MAAQFVIVPSVRAVRAALLAALCAACVVMARPESYTCEARVYIDGRWVCGLHIENGGYASFLGVPYAKQPLGELRFKELQPLKPRPNKFFATEEGPICYQTDVIYGRIMQPQGMNEACIHANIHVPISALPIAGLNLEKGLPILVFVHGGGFQGGSGDTDLHGPEYLLRKNVIVITFNYRLNVFGFLSLNSPEIPGNQGLRDQVTLLRWVQKNAQGFGGDPNNVTLMGQSAGAAAVHLLTLSKAAQGLFQRAFLMSGTGTTGFYSASPQFAEQVSSIFLAIVGINSTTPATDIHRQLIAMPVEKIHQANQIMLEHFGLTTFVPTVESAFPGVTRILDEDPELLVAMGRGQNVSLVIGFTNVECEVFRRRFDHINITNKIIDNPVLTVPANIIYTTPPDLLLDIAKRIDQKYYNGKVDTDGFIRYCTDGLYKYPALKLAEKRAALGGAPVFLYQFSYDGENSVLRKAFDLDYKGAAHIEDLTYVFRVNSMLTPQDTFPKDRDDDMKEWMTMFLTNFMQCSEPVCDESESWTPVWSKRLQFQDIREPNQYRLRDLTAEQLDILQFFDSLRHK